MNIKTRLKSWAVWLSVLCAVGVIHNSFGLFEAWGITSDGWQNIITAIGSILVGFGILNNPTDKEKF